ncbi:hypothetical protein A2886_01925 [candidate division WWE3 bacterium RIFCSPHIGHO2_01_FULL_42_13]|uniref:Uncharacterized protein n=1 Tax=candidate division WWE3 bacterium RIFCSPHIGHO2_01_FULL_42_13 TaxID=1802617 RepID=A0A1F4UR40_UNCKA|nr:MAG: hypothetical protein A2886_01925 [candidate division WWE3 bacterium RIFCSPHIGHO2_01_FULL_42_13]
MGPVFARLKIVNKGFAHIIVVLGLVGIAVATIFILKPSKTSIDNPFQQQNTERVSWEFDNNSKSWRSLGTPPVCREPLVFPSPVDVSLVSGVLYPGQVRGGDYKAHGGFRFDGLENNLVNVYAPMDANLIEAAQHPSAGEFQYVLYFLDDCGIIYKLDHLRELTPKFAEIVSKIPMGGENDTRTTRIRPTVFTKKGELVATKVGLESNKNVFVDFGVYDLRQPNGVSYEGRNYFNIEQWGNHAICWLDNLEEADKVIVKSLPGADGQSGKNSDYCH